MTTRRRPGGSLAWFGVGSVLVLVAVTALVLGVFGTSREASPQPIAPTTPDAPTVPIPGLGANGWVALDVSRDDGRGGAIHLVRPGKAARPLDVDRSSRADDGCPAWSPDGARLLFGRLHGSPGSAGRDAELVIVPVSRGGAAGPPTVIELDGFEAPVEFSDHPCATWAPDGRWVALAGRDAVWVVDTRTRELRELPDLRANDIAWRPGTDELTVAGTIGTAEEGVLSSPVTVYSVTSNESHELGSVRAASITWSPDGTTLAYTPGEEGPDQLRLVDADGTGDRVLVDELSTASFGGAGPMWSPDGSRIAYQRGIVPPPMERAEIVLVDVTDGSQRVIEPPTPPDLTPLGEHTAWWPRWSTWSPDGTMLLYSAWCNLGPRGLDGDGHATIAVPVDDPQGARIITDLNGGTGEVSHAEVQVWGRR